MVFDIIFIILFIYALYGGLRRGLISQVTELIALILGVYIAYKFSFLLGNVITDYGAGAQAVSIISFIITFIIVVVIARILGAMLNRLISVILLGWLNKLLGATFFILKMAFIISISLFILNTIDREIPFLPQKQIAASVFYRPISKLAPSIFPYLKMDKIVDTMKGMDKQLDKAVEKLKKK
jgi:membrane protein required for colicin V production